MRLWLQERGYIFLLQRYKSPFSEIDLIFLNSSRKNLILIEVKSVKSQKSWTFFKISQKQKERLSQAYEFFIAHSPIPVHFHLALVLRSGEIKLVKDFLNF